MQANLRSVFQRRWLLAPVALVLWLAVIPTPHARADAPACRYMITADTVLDLDTDLTWQRIAGASTYTWLGAATYCNDLVLAEQTDWRMPTVHELQTIVDEGAINPAIDATAFPSAPATFFWSSSPYAGDPNQAWVIGFYYGNVSPDDMGYTYSIRCVR